MFSASVVIEDAICFIIIQSNRWSLSYQNFCGSEQQLKLYADKQQISTDKM